MKLRDQMFEMGRHFNTHIISVSHDALVGKDTKTVKSEATSVILYPQFTQQHQMKEYLTKYVGFDKKRTKMIMTLPSRWVFINLNAPNYLVTPTEVKLLL